MLSLVKWSQLNWGDVPTWVAAIGTVGVSLWLLGFQIRDRRRSRLAHLRAYAEAVSVWIHERDFLVRGDQPYHPSLSVRVSNAADVAIHQVAIRVEVGIRGTFVRESASIPPHGTREWRIDLPNSPRGDPGCLVSFTDARGERWVRSSSGELIRFDAWEARRGDFHKQDPAAFDLLSHPTLNPPREDREAWEGRIV